MRKLIVFVSFLISFFIFTNIVYALCDINITESMLPFTINQNNTYYCLNETSYIEGQTAITFANPTQNSTLDCLGYNLDNNDTDYTYGVYLNNITNNTVKNCNITDFYSGIYIFESNNNTLINNTANDNNHGIYLYHLSNNNTLTNNTANNNNHGIYIYYGPSNNVLTNNTANNNDNYGIYFYTSNNNTLINNTANNNSVGIFVYYGSDNTNLTSNTANNNEYGIRLYFGPKNTTLTDNIANNNTYGIYLSSVTNTNLTGGSISNNTYDYYIDSTGATNNFTNTNFTASRTIHLYGTTTYFNYNNESSGNIWLKTNVSAVTTITRKLISWNQSLMQWNDSSNPVVTARYNITGLSPNTIYRILNNSVLTYTLQTDSNGDLNFTIYLSSENEIKLLIPLADGSSCTSNSECSGGYCVHNICRSTPTYCGDGYCDSGESCDICVLDCGFCPGDGETPSPLPTEYQPPEEPTEFPTEEITLPIPGTPITIPEKGLTVRLEPKFVIALYPLTNLTAIIHNVTKIEKPSKYKILLRNQTLIASYEINITVDLAYFCANYSGYNIEDPTVNIFKFEENDWIPLKTEDIAKNSEKKIICGKITFTPYIVTGFTPTIDSKTALLAINNVNRSIIITKEQGVDVSKAEELLEKALFEYYSCNYAKAKELADKALESLVTIPPWLIPVSFVAIAIVAIAWFWYYTGRIKVRVKK